MQYLEEIQLFGLDWALLHFIENDGMAFGIIFPGDHGKLLLSLFRLLAVSFLIYFIRELIRLGAGNGLLISFSLILAGATGNILDSAFYGLFFSASTVHGPPAELFPPEGGYAGFLHGNVVDMFHFPVFKGVYPYWIPWIGGKSYQFFKPVFNIADVAITLGVLNILIFQRRYFLESRRLTKNEIAYYE